MNNKSVRFSQPDSKGNPVDEVFESLFGDHKNRMFDLGIVHTYPPQSVIFHQDTLPHAVYLIERGLVKLVRVVDNGKSIIVGLRRRHWLIGAPAVLLNGMYTYTPITLVSSSLRCIPARDFLELVKNNEDFSWYLHLLFAQEISRQAMRLEAKSCLSAKDRMKLFLRIMIDEQTIGGRKPPDFSLPLTNKEISQLLGITPEHLSRVLKEIMQEGFIKCSKGAITVTDTDNLI